MCACSGSPVAYGPDPRLVPQRHKLLMMRSDQIVPGTPKRRAAQIANGNSGNGCVSGVCIGVCGLKKIHHEAAPTTISISAPSATRRGVHGIAVSVRRTMASTTGQLGTMTLMDCAVHGRRHC